MKNASIIAAAVLTFVAATGVAYAADNSGAAKAAEPQAENTVTKPHSHVQEKTGAPQSVSEQKASGQNAAKDRNKHFHPRDGK